jgi:hypothetical protein
MMQMEEKQGYGRRKTKVEKRKKERKKKGRGKEFMAREADRK